MNHVHTLGLALSLNKRKSRLYVSVVSLLLYLTVGFSSTANLVLCFGSDGHIALENGINGVCSDQVLETTQTQSTVDNQAQSSMSTIQGKTCTDIPISLNNSTDQNVSWVHSFGFLQDKIVVNTDTSFPINVFLKTKTENLLPQPPPLTNETLDRLRTVILLV